MRRVGSIDFVARLTGAKLAEGLGQSVVIVNRDGVLAARDLKLSAASAPLRRSH